MGMLRCRIKLDAFCKRWYSFRVRNDVFYSRSKAGGLILNGSQEGLPRILWRYFNAPGNITFVTVNIVTFAGIVTYDSLISPTREHMLEEKLFIVQNIPTCGEDTSFKKSYEDKNNDLCSEELQKRLDEVAENKTLEDRTSQESPLPVYSASSLYLERKGPQLAAYNSQVAKMSIFHMMYAYFLCKHVISDGSLTYSTSPYLESEFWKKEVELLRNKDLPKHDSNNKSHGDEGRGFMNAFYSSWKHDFSNVFTNLHKSQRFHFPDWKYYPGNLRYICRKLYSNEMTTVEDFKQFYDAIESRDLKRLLRIWFYDYSHLVKPIKGNMESFYGTLVQDCHADDVLFNKYSSILLNPTNPRKYLFFTKHGIRDVPSASMDTVLCVLQGYVSLHEKQGKQHYDSIVRLISMMRKDCFLVKHGKGSNSYREVRVILPKDEERQQLELLTRNLERKKCYQLVSNNPTAVKLLDMISNWKDI